MSIKLFRIFFALFVISIFSEKLMAEEKIKSLGKFKNWEVFTAIVDANKICFAQSVPLIRTPKKLKREPSRLFVSFRPSENIKNEISVTNGYEILSDTTILAKSGKSSFELFPEGKFAWVMESKDEKKLIKKMKLASRLMIIGKNSNGKVTTDHYSMMGFTKAYNAAKKGCS